MRPHRFRHALRRRLGRMVYVPICKINVDALFEILLKLMFR